MADKTIKAEGNVAGKYYIDENCTLCALCEGMAPDNIAVNESGDFEVIVKQPANDDEVAAMGEAIESCPVESIGDDGE